MRHSNRTQRIRRERSGRSRVGSGQTRSSGRAMQMKPGSALRPASARSQATEHETNKVHNTIDAELHTIGLEQFSESIAERMELIEVLAIRFNNDSRAVRRMCLEVMDRMPSRLEPALRSTLHANRKRDISIAAYLHDIGKSGPFDASQEAREAVVKLYAVENLANPDQTVAETVRANFSIEETEGILAHLGSCGVHSAATMRTFWDCHAYWTHDILEADSEHIPARARVIAGSHHMDRGIDPYDCSRSQDADMCENRILMAVDKYQAAVARGRRTHDEAMDLLKGILFPKYGNDVFMNRVLSVLDEVGREAPSLAEAA